MTDINKIKDTLKQFKEEVVLANRLAGNDLSDKDLIKTYDNLVVEESKEILDAGAEGNNLELLDGLVDTMVVSYYNLQLRGIDCTIEDTAGVISETRLCECLAGEIDTLQRLISQTRNKELGILASYYGAMLWLFAGNDLNWNACEALLEVTRSNFTKFVPDKLSEEVVESEIKRIEDEGRYGGVFSEFVEVDSITYTIFKAKEDVRDGVKYEKPKYLKAYTYEAPNLEPFLVKEGK